MNSPAPSSSDVYYISVRNVLDEGWIRALEIEPIETQRHYAGPPRTVLVLRMSDQAELLGLLNRLHNMGLKLLAVESDSSRIA
jgi:hypothetical protein